MAKFHSIQRTSVWVVLVAGIAALPALSGQVMVQGQKPDKRDGEFWRQRAHKKVMEDSRKLVELTRDLHEEAEERKRNPLPQSVLDRIDALEERAAELREMIEDLSEHFLSLPALEKADAIQTEAKSLEETFEASPARRELGRLRRLAHDISKRANSLADHMRTP